MLKFLETDFMSFQSQLNPALWDDKTLRPEVRSQLLIIAKYFQEKFEITQKPYDIYFTGSLANYNYNESSDIDLHFVFDYEELGDFDFIEDYFKAKKDCFNSEHDIFIKGYPVEIGTEDINTPLESTGVYSVKNNKWVVEPQPITAEVEDVTTTESWIKLLTEVRDVLKRNNRDEVKELWDSIKEMRKTGLASGGELHPYNLLFKELRRSGVLEVIKNRLTKLTDQVLSLDEERYLNPETNQWEEDDDEGDKTWSTNSEWAKQRERDSEIARKIEQQRQAENLKRKHIKEKNKQRRLNSVLDRYTSYLNIKDKISDEDRHQMEVEFGKIKDPEIKEAIAKKRDEYYARKNESVNILKGRFS